ncbi:RNA polymerase sigma factor [Brevibacillus brevis]|uniref:RNA polymerase sigma factor n=1 Tax=Brevibacillus brevis TaxID=1393 RepID=UPI00115B19D7|nr:RNA polymerase sigma factor [Lysinibacillus sp. SDF0063]TQR35516.1 RNA polymerase sigma factor [Lysinibacillus sp. SDF0063]
MQEDIEQRISAIYHAHYQDVYYFLLHFTGNQNDAEDLTQEVFTRVLKGLAGFDGRVTLKTWLFSIAKHAAIDQHRKQKVKSFFSENWLMKLATKEGSPENVLTKRENVRELKQAIQKLAPHYRLVLILRCIEEYSIKETAEILGVSESKVKVNTHRALKLVKEMMDDTEEGGLLNEWARG